MYESPIDVIYNDMVTKLEDGILKALQDVCITVDKEELIKALQYDRDQYRKGYEDAVERQRGEWIAYQDGKYHCSRCDDVAPKGYRWNFCPNCGARMYERREE